MDTTAAWTMRQLRDAFAEYSKIINDSDRALNTKITYISHADRFLRWLDGQVDLANPRTGRPRHDMARHAKA